ncbi:flagellin [Desulfuromonas thiophila]|uniref:flagellin n=1 Tax=Desulfuromonas thiophila TaxID=57664 RepID=UPI0038995043
MASALNAGDLKVNGVSVRATDGTASDAAAALNTAIGSTVATAVNSQTFDFEDVQLTGDVTTEVGTTGTPTGGIGETPATARITGLTDVSSATVTGVDITIDGSRLEIDWAAVTSADSTITGWSDVTTTDKLATVLNAQDGLSAQNDSGTLILETEAGSTMAFGPNGALTAPTAVGVIDPASTGGTDATPSTASITGLTDALAASVTGIDIAVGGSAVTIDWAKATAADATITGWADVTSGAQLATVLNSQDDLDATYAAGTLSISSANGETMEFGLVNGAGALQGTASVGTPGAISGGTAATIGEVTISGITDAVANSVSGVDIEVDGGPLVVDFTGTGYAGWGEINDATELTDLLNQQTNLNASYDAGTDTLTLSTAAGYSIGTGSTFLTSGKLGTEAGSGTTELTISDLDDVLAAGVTGLDIAVSSDANTNIFAAANLAAVTSGGELAAFITDNSGGELTATYDQANDELTITSTDADTLALNAASPAAGFLTAASLGVDGTPQGGDAATPGTGTIAISDAQAATVTDLDISIEGVALNDDAAFWAKATAADPTITSWDDVDSGEKLATVLNAQDNLNASFAGGTLTLSTTAGMALEFGADGALFNDVAEVGTTGAVTPGDVALVGTAGITGLTDDIAAGITGTNIEIDGVALEVDFTAAGMTGWSDVNSIANLETLLNAQDDLSAAYDGGTGRLTLTTTEGKTLSFSEATPFTGSDEVGTTGVVAGGAATPGELIVTSLDDVAAESVTGLDLTVGGDTIAIDWSATAYTGWSQVDDATKLRDVINNGTNGKLTASYNAGTDTLTLASAAGEAIEAGADGAFLHTESTTGTYTLSVNGEDVGVAAGLDGDVNVSDVADAINTWSAAGAKGITASVDATTNKISLSNETGAAITLTEVATSVAAGEGFANDVANMAGVAHQGQVVLTSSDDLTFEGDLTKVGLEDEGVDTVTIDAVDISTREGAVTAIASVDSALAQIDTMRGDLGAVQNRFESTIANLNNVSENLSAARSRILDADIAEETSAMTKNNILQQAGVSILAQANQAPQLALSLLG